MQQTRSRGKNQIRKKALPWGTSQVGEKSMSTNLQRWELVSLLKHTWRMSLVRQSEKPDPGNEDRQWWWKSKSEARPLPQDNKLEERQTELDDTCVGNLAGSGKWEQLGQQNENSGKSEVFDTETGTRAGERKLGPDLPSMKPGRGPVAGEALLVSGGDGKNQARSPAHDGGTGKAWRRWTKMASFEWRTRQSDGCCFPHEDESDRGVASRSDLQQ
jgi:hypothetical protein